MRLHPLSSQVVFGSRPVFEALRAKKREHFYGLYLRSLDQASKADKYGAVLINIIIYYFIYYFL